MKPPPIDNDHIAAGAARFTPAEIAFNRQKDGPSFGENPTYSLGKIGRKPMPAKEPNDATIGEGTRWKRPTTEE